MSFSAEIKQELCNLSSGEGAQRTALCYGMLRFARSCNSQTITLVTEHPGFARFASDLIVEECGVFVDMEIPSDIQDIPPDCVYMVSPGASNLISTAGIVVPIILYFIGSSLSGVLNDENTLVLLYPKDTQG